MAKKKPVVPSPVLLELHAERAAILEFDAHYSREDAERLAWEDPLIKSISPNKQATLFSLNGYDLK